MHSGLTPAIPLRETYFDLLSSSFKALKDQPAHEPLIMVQYRHERVIYILAGPF